MSVKFSVFADLHYLPGTFYTNAGQRLDAIRDRAVESGSEFVIHCGDLCHEPTKCGEILRKYREFPMPTYTCLGNHEFERESAKDVLDAYGMKEFYYFFDRGGYRFVVLDTNYMSVNGVTTHFELHNHRPMPEGAERRLLPPEEIAWLEQTVMESPYPCVLFSHQSLERVYSDGPLARRREVWELLERLNRDKRRILLAINGHYHMDFLRIRDNIAFLDLNSASYDWIEEKHAGVYPEEIYRDYSLVSHTLLWNDPIHAVITLGDHGEIEIEGGKSEYFCGLDREKAGIPITDADGRLGTAEVQSASLVLPLYGWDR